MKLARNSRDANANENEAAAIEGTASIVQDRPQKKKSNCCVVMVVHFEDLLDVSEFWRKKIENVTSSTVARHVRFVGFTTIVLSSF